MTTKKLTATDFMMMDVHEPLSTQEINQINPQAAVDKTLGAVEDHVRDDESVGSTGERCEVCFAPTPCADHANVAQFNVVTSLDIDPVAILAGAHNKGLAEVVIVGFTDEGEEYFASSISDAGQSMYHLQRGIYKLNKILDQEEHERREGPSAA
jgi:hypothetical protein